MKRHFDYDTRPRTRTKAHALTSRDWTVLKTTAALVFVGALIFTACSL
jgi:hypothetical protein